MADGGAIQEDPVAGGVEQGVEPPVDAVTGLPLLLCPDCRDVRFVAFTVRNPASVNLGRRFFKCPRNQAGVPRRCRRYYFVEDYVRFIVNPSVIPAINAPGGHAVAVGPQGGAEVNVNDAVGDVVGEGHQGEEDEFVDALGHDVVHGHIGEEELVDQASEFSLVHGVCEAEMESLKHCERNPSRYERSVAFWFKVVVVELMALNLFMGALVFFVFTQ